MQGSEAGRAPNEDEPAISEAWRKLLHPRRGGIPGPALVPRPLTWREGADTTPEEAAQRALRMFPEPGGTKLYVFVDTWVRDRGHGFAAAATLEFGRDRTAALRKPRLATYLRMRRYLAEADEPDYVAAVQAMDPHRTHAVSRLIAAYLAPTESAWSDEACAVVRASIDGAELKLLAGVVSTPQQLARFGAVNLIGYGTGLAELVTLADRLGAAALPVFADVLDDRAYLSADTRRLCLSVVAALPGDEAFEALAARLDQKYFSAALLEATEHFPRRALRILAGEAASSRGRKAADAREALQRHVRIHRELAEAAVDKLPEASAAIVRELLPQAASAEPTAVADEVPPFLATPPWRREDGPKAVEPEPKAVAGLKVALPTRVVWAEQDAEKAADAAPANPRRDYAATATEIASRMNAGVLDDWGDRLASELFSCGPVEPGRELLIRWRPAFDWAVEDRLWPILRRFGADAVPALVHNARKVGPREAGTLLLPLLDIEAARLMAAWFARLKTGREAATAWFDRHGADAAVLLIPDAVGKPGRGRAAAAAALRHLAAALPELVELARTEYGADAAEAVRAILAADSTAPPPPAPPTLPSWLDLAALPQVLLRGGQAALPDEATRALLEAFALTAAPEPVPGLAENLRTTLDALDPVTVAEFCWEAFSAWRAATHPPRQAWALSVLGLVGDDRTAERLTPLIKAWPGESGHHRATAGLDVLADIGTDQALQLLSDIASRVRFKALKDAAVGKIAQVAAQRGLTGEQLADRLVPDLGLDADGGLWLGYGPRRFRVGFDEQLKPFVTDEAGKRRKDLPSPNAEDDAELAAAARAGFAALKKQARTVAGTEIRRLEAALVEQRAWTAEEFNTLLLTHPLLRHVVRRLLWVAAPVGDTGVATREGFRVAEDGTLANLADEAYALPPDATVRLAHPLAWPQGLAAWGEVFADYEILQPFQQLDRPVYKLADEERGGHRLTRFEGRTVPIGRVLGLTGQGWRRSPAQDNGIENCITKRLGDELYLVIDLDDGIPVGYVTADWAAEQTLEAVYLSDRAEVYHQGRRKDSSLRFADLDPLTACELLGQLTRLVD